MAQVKTGEENQEAFQQHGQILNLSWPAVLLQERESIAPYYMVDSIAHMQRFVDSKDV